MSIFAMKKNVKVLVDAFAKTIFKKVFPEFKFFPSRIPALEMDSKLYPNKNWACVAAAVARGLRA